MSSWAPWSRLQFTAIFYQSVHCICQALDFNDFVQHHHERPQPMLGWFLQSLFPLQPLAVLLLPYHDDIYSHSRNSLPIPFLNADRSRFKSETHTLSVMLEFVALPIILVYPVYILVVFLAQRRRTELDAKSAHWSRFAALKIGFAAIALINGAIFNRGDPFLDSIEGAFNQNIAIALIKAGIIKHPRPPILEGALNQLLGVLVAYGKILAVVIGLAAILSIVGIIVMIYLAIPAITAMKEGPSREIASKDSESLMKLGDS
ncbi:hypothetical protein C8J56DRAFT_477494 [Mycena floridula]|nr:hypothetical protein C8J56DRAFT_477494 [Mycena floridula]